MSVSVEEAVLETTTALPVSSVETKPEDRKIEVHCDVYVGTSGTGKSTLCRTRARAEDKHLFQPKSGAIAGSKKPVLGWASDTRLLDTQGFLDTEGKEDIDIRIELLQAIYDGAIDSVRIVWCVLPNERATDELQKQAAFIVSLLPKGEDATEFWANSVLIIVKDQLEAKYQLGAIEAAVRNGAEKEQVKVRSVKILDFITDKRLRAFYSSWTNEERIAECILKLDELAAFQQSILCEMSGIGIVKRDEMCERCGLIGDRRLWPRNCHTAFRHIHYGSYGGIGRYIVEQKSRIIKTSAMCGGAVTAPLVIPECSDLVAAGVMSATDACVAGACASPFYGVAGAMVGVSGAAAVLGTMALTDYATSKWSCCGAQYGDSEPCTLVCINCGAVKGMRNEETDCKCDSPHLRRH